MQGRAGQGRCVLWCHLTSHALPNSHTTHTQASCFPAMTATSLVFGKENVKDGGGQCVKSSNWWGLLNRWIFGMVTNEFPISCTWSSKEIQRC